MVWNTKMKVLQTKVYDKNILVNAKKEKLKLADLATFEEQLPAGPFISKEEVIAHQTV